MRAASAFDFFSNLEDLSKTIASKNMKPFASFSACNSRVISEIAYQISNHLTIVEPYIVINHPIKSPYSNYLMHGSGFNIFKEGFGDVILVKEYRKRYDQASDNIHELEVKISGCLFTDVNQSFRLCNHQISRAKLISSEVLTLENVPFKQKLFIPADVKLLPKGCKVAKAEKLSREKIVLHPRRPSNRDPRLLRPSVNNGAQELAKKKEGLKRGSSELANGRSRSFGGSLAAEAVEGKRRRKVSNKTPTFEEFQKIDKNVIDQTRIDFELRKFDSVFMLKNFRHILIPYIIEYLENNRRDQYCKTFLPLLMVP